MKKILFLVLTNFIALPSFAQNFGFSYQAVALDKARGQSFGYDSEGKPLSNTEITVRFTLSEGSENGPTAYQETHGTKTDEFGMFRLIVGRGATDSSTPLHLLNWGAAPYFMHVEVDYGSGLEYMGVEELLGTPYSFSATSPKLELVENVLKISNGNEVFLSDLDSLNEIQDLDLTGNTLTITNNGTATDIDLSTYLDNTDTQLTEAQVDGFADNNGYLTTEVDGSLTNEIQDLELTGNTLTITNNGTATDIDLSTYLGNTDTQLTEVQVDAFANNNGYLTTEVDGSLTNEIQDLDLTGNTLTITNNGTATDIDLSAYLDNTDTQLTEAQVDAFADNNGYLTTEVDGSLTNEIQDLELTGNTLTITNNGTATDIDLSTYLDNTDTQLTEAQVDGFADNNGYLTTEVDGSLTNEIQDLDLTGNTLTITNNGTATGIDLSTYLNNTDTQLTEAQVDAFADNNGYLTTEVDGSLTNEIQDLELTGNTLTITNNGTATDIDLSTYLDNTDTQLTEAQVDGFADNNGYLTTEVDGSLTNEIQDLELTGNTLTITNNGTATDIDLSTYLDNTDTQLTEAQVDAFTNNNGYLTTEVDGSLTNEIQDLELTGNTLTITNNGTATDIDLSAYLDNTDTQLTEAQVDAFTNNNGYLTTEVDGSLTNEIQDLDLTGNTLTITNNGTATDIDLSPYLDNTDTQLTEAQVDAFADNNGYLTTEVDGSLTNEIQDLDLTGNTLTITDNGTATDIDLSAYLDNTDTQLTEAQVDAFTNNNGYLTTEVDGSLTNEIQDLDLTGNTLTITNNGTATDIDLSAYLDNTDTQLTEAQVDHFADNNGYLTTEVDGSLTNEIQDLDLTRNTLTITNNGTATDIDLSPYLDNTDTQLTEAQVDAFADNNGYLTTEVDGSLTNEIQDLDLTGNTLTITNNGTATDIDLSAYLDNTDTQLTEAQVDDFADNNGYLTTEVDGSLTNEIQDLGLTRNTLTITNNGTATDIDLSPYLDNTDTQLTEAQVDAFADNNGYLTTEVDGSLTNEIQDLDLTGNMLTITNNGTATDIDLSPYLDNTDTQLTEAQVDDFANNNGYLTTEIDGSLTNEIQDLDLTGNTLIITNNGTATDIDLSPYLDNTDTQLTEAQVDAFADNNGYLTTEVDGSLTNEIQDLDLTGNMLTITNNGTATDIDLSPYLDNTDTQLTEAQVDDFVNNNGYLTTEVDGSLTNEIQDLELTGNTLTITNNGTATDIDLSTYLDNTDTQLTEAQVDDFVNNNGYLTTEVDGSLTNEIQDLELTGNTLTITNNGTATDIDLSSYLDNTDTQLTEAQVDGFADNNGYLITEVDGSLTNEIQDLELTGNTLTITNNGTATDIDLSAYLDNTDTQLTEAQVDGFADNNGYLITEVDGSLTNEIQDLDLTGNTLTITNNGTATNIDLSTYLDNTDTQLTEAQVDDFANNNGYLTTEVDGSLTNEIQDLELTVNTLTITNNGTATDIDLSPYLDNTDTQLTEAQVDGFADNNGYLITEVDGSLTNEIQDLDLTGNMLTITNNGTATDIDLSSYLDNTDTQLTEAQVDDFADNNGYLTTEVDGSLTNEIQDLELTGNMLTITNNGTATDIDLSPYLDNTDIQLTEAQVDAFADNNGYLTTEVDGSLSNEINTAFAVSGGNLQITDSNGTLSVSLASLQDGNVWKTTGNSGTNPATNFIGTTDNQDLSFRVNNTEKLSLTTKGTLEFLNTGNSVFIGEDAGANDDLSDNRNVGVGYQTLLNNTTGVRNSASGYQALYSNTTGNNNTAAGYQALFYNTTGFDNTAIGYKSLIRNTTGTYNTAIGYYSLLFNGTGSRNTASGYESLYGNTTGHRNTASGFQALYDNTTGDQNTAFGAEALATNNSGDNNTASGYKALYRNRTGNNNTANGYAALENNTEGNNNTANGYYTLLNNTTGDNNTGLGYNTGQGITTGSYNTILGANVTGLASNLSHNIILSDGQNVELQYATNVWDFKDNDIKINNLAANQLIYANSDKQLASLADGIAGQILRTDGSGVYSWVAPSTDWKTTGNSGTNPSTHFIGTTDNQPLHFKVNNTQRMVLDNKGHLSFYGTGSSVYIGELAGTADDLTNNQNVAVGHSALRDNTNGALNVAIGFEALRSNTLGGNNTVNGYQAMQRNSTGSRNSAYGSYALQNNRTGNENTAIGNLALWKNSTGNSNTATGYWTLVDNKGGSYNTANGYKALEFCTTGSSNTAMGASALSKSTTAFGNTAIGSTAMKEVTTGIFNTAVGVSAMKKVTTGVFNTAVGYETGPSTGNLRNTIAIGYATEVTTNNTAVIGDANMTSIGGAVAWSIISDGRFKTKVQEDVPGLDFILNLRPVTYSWDMDKLNQFQGKTNNALNGPAEAAAKHVKETKRHTGFIAQEVEQIAASVGYDFDAVKIPENEKSHYSLSYAEFVVPLVKAVQEQQATIEQQQQSLAEKDQNISKLSKRLEALELLVKKLAEDR